MEIFLLASLVLIGFILTRKQILKQAVINWASKWIIYVALPAVALLNLPGLSFSISLLIPIFSPIIVFIGSVVFFDLILRGYFNENQRLVLVVLGGLGNTSFVGFPVISYLYEIENLSTAVIIDQITFLLLSTVAYWLIVKRTSDVNWKDSIKKIILFPPLLALIVALIIPPDLFPPIIQEVLRYIAITLSPIAMLIIGFQIAKYLKFRISKPAQWGMIYKLLIAPLLVVLVFFTFDNEYPLFEITVVESGMAPMISAGILLNEKNIDNELTAEFLCWGMIFSILTLSAWYLFLG